MNKNNQNVPVTYSCGPLSSTPANSSATPNGRLYKHNTQVTLTSVLTHNYTVGEQSPNYFALFI